MKTLFIAGKGGTGKSTLTCALGYQLSEKKYKTLVVSLDPAHNISDIFQQQTGSRISCVNSHLDIYEPDITSFSDMHIKRNTESLRQLYSRLKTVNLDYYLNMFENSPSKEDYGTIRVLEYVLTEYAGYDYILFDTPPTGLFMRILSSVKMNICWTERLLKLRKAILEKRHTIHNITGKYSTEGVRLAYREEDDPVFNKLLDILKKQNMIYSHIRSSSSRIIAVLNTDILSLKETQRLFKSIGDLDLEISGCFLNKCGRNQPEYSRIKSDFENLIKMKPCLKVRDISPGNDFPDIHQDLTGIIL